MDSMALYHSFAGKRVLVTGGGQGIGRQIVQRFHNDGAIVFTIDKNPETIQQLQETLPGITAKVVDLGNWDETKKVVESFGVIDHLVNNAGIMIPQSFMSTTEEALIAQFRINLFAIVNVSQIVSQSLIKAGKPGTIVNLCSIAAKRGSSFCPVYYATKAGVENLTKSMAVELGQHNIRVNCIAPGLVSSSMANSDNPEMVKRVNTILQRMVNKRAIEPDEIADLVMFLLSPLSAMIIGEMIVIDGGNMLS